MRSAASYGSLGVRLAVAAAAIAAIALLAGALGSEHRCSSARDAFFSTAFRRGASIAGQDAAIDRVATQCRGTTDLVGVAATLAAAGHPARALAVAHRAARREPRNVQAWQEMWLYATRAHAPTLARTAAERLSVLDPLQAPRQPALKRSAGRSTT